MKCFRGHDNNVIAATESGPASGPPVLLAHGGGQTKRAWRQTTERLNYAGFRTIAIDLRGHGESDWSNDGAYDLTDFAKDVLEIVDQLGSRVAFVGASLGGLAGLIAEGEMREGTFVSLSLVDVTPHMDLNGANKIAAFMERHIDEGFASLEEAAAVISGYASNRKNRAASDGLAHYLKQGVDRRYRWHWDPEFIRGGGGRSAMATDRLEDAARSLNLPVQLLRGQKSDLVTAEAVKAFLDFVPHARFDDIKGAGHMVVGDKNDAFSSAILDFLTLRNRHAAPEPMHP